MTESHIFLLVNNRPYIIRKCEKTHNDGRCAALFLPQIRMFEEGYIRMNSNNRHLFFLPRKKIYSYEYITERYYLFKWRFQAG